MVAVGKGLVAQYREGRSAVSGVHYIDVVHVGRGGGVPVVQSQMPVARVAEDGVLGRILLHHLNGTNDLDVALMVCFHHVPSGTEIDILCGGVEEGERYVEKVPVAKVMYSVPGVAEAYIIIADGQGVDPALEGSVHIAVQYHVVREFLELYPFVLGYSEGTFHVFVKDVLPFVQHPLYLVCPLYGGNRGKVEE